MQAQDRSRSPSGVSGLPESHGLYAVAQHAGVSSMPAAGVAEDKAWFTGDPTLDYWVLKNILQPAVRGGLSLIAKEEAKNIIRQCMLRQGTIRHMPGYFQGCIRKAISAAELNRSGGNVFPSPPADVRTVARPLGSVASPGRAEACPAPGVASVAASSVHAAAAVESEVLVTSGPQALAASNVIVTETGNDAGEALPWARACLAALASKSKLLRIFYAQLDAQALSAISSLSEVSQVHVAIAVCLASTPSTCASNLCQRFVSSLKHLTQASEQLPAVPSAPEDLQVVILHLGSVVGMGHVAMKAAFATVLQRRSSVNVHVLEMHSIVSGELFSRV